jgi:hypothetical protein
MDAETVRPAGAPEPQGPLWRLGADGRYYSTDGLHWWDGRSWQRLPRGPIGRWAVAHQTAYPLVVAVVSGGAVMLLRLTLTLLSGASVPEGGIVLLFWMTVPGLIGWSWARGQLKQWGARNRPGGGAPGQ